MKYQNITISDYKIVGGYIFISQQLYPFNVPNPNKIIIMIVRELVILYNYLLSFVFVVYVLILLYLEFTFFTVRFSFNICLFAS